MINKKINVLDVSITMKSRMGFMWSLTFLYQAGFIVAWIMTTSLFIEFFGIQNLLWLFLAESCFIFMGSILSHILLQKIEIGKVLFWATIIILILLFGGFFLRNGRSNEIEMLFLAILAKDLIYPRLRIGLLRKTESLFSPEQAEKAIPMIDSALTIGLVVMSGIILIVLEFFPHMPTQDILFIWALPISLTGGMLFFEEKFLKKVPHIYHKYDSYENKSNSFDNIFQEIKKAKFLKYLLVVIILQSMLYTVTEFEFIKQLNSHFLDSSSSFSLDLKSLQTSVFSDFKEDFKEGVQEIKSHTVNVLKSSTSKIYAHETLLHDLTGLSLIFGLIALIVQFLITPWVLEKWGIVKIINIYFAGFLVTTFSFIFGGHMPINFVRGFEHSCHSLFMSGYHLSFYSVKELHREFIRNIVEGMITPLGIILGVVIVAILKYLNLLYFLPLIIAVIAALTFSISLSLHKFRIELAKNNLEEASSLSQKIRAIEVLGQKGQHNAHYVLAKELKKPEYPQGIREKIAETLSKINNLETIHTYINILEQEQEKEELKIKVLESLLQMEKVKEYSKKRHFMRFKLVKVLRELFEQSKDIYLKKLIVMNIFQHLHDEEIVPFFYEVMESENEILQSVCLRSCTIFNDPDIMSFVSPYLSHSSARVRSHAAIALWKFDDKEKIRGILNDFLSADNHEVKIAGIYAIGEIDDRESLPKLHYFSREENLEIRLHSLVARAKMGDEKTINGILELLFSADEKTAHKMFNMLKRGVPVKIREKIKEAIYREVAHRVEDIVGPYLDINESKKDLSKSVIQYLKRLYFFAGRYDDLLILEQRYF